MDAANIAISQDKRRLKGIRPSTTATLLFSNDYITPGNVADAGVLVAADCEEIASVVRSFGGRVELTSPDCASGTDRVAEIARKLPNADVLVQSCRLAVMASAASR